MMLLCWEETLNIQQEVIDGTPVTKSKRMQISVTKSRPDVYKAEYGPFSKKEHMLSHKTNLFYKTNLIKYIL